MTTVAALISALPDTVRVGAFDIAIKIVDRTWADDDQWGEFDFNKLTITLSSDQPSAAFFCDTFIHECLHAIFKQSIEEADSEERIVNAFGQGFIRLLRDNQWLIKWLDMALKPKGKKNATR